MADDYARYALSQRDAFAATHPAALAAAAAFAAEPVLRVVDLGAADGVNSHGLIRDLIRERAGRPLIYALVDLPTNPWSVATDHLQRAFGGAADGAEVVVIPASGDAGSGVADAGTGASYATPEAHDEACRRALELSPPPTTVISLAGIPLQQAPCLPSGSVHVAVTGTAMHWSRTQPGSPRPAPCFPGTRITSTRANEELGASPRRINGNGCWRCAQRSSRRVAGSSPRSQPPPLRAAKGRGCMWRSSGT